MDKLSDKKKEFQALYLSGKYTQKEIADKLGVSRITINQWVKDLPVTAYMRVRKSLICELERLTQKPQGNEALIFQYIQNLDLLDKMIRKAKFLPKL